MSSPMSPSTKPSRFLALPREIRDKIYRILLCSSGQRPTSWTPPDIDDPAMFAFLDKLEILQHSNTTTILRTSKQIHREAYDVLVKTNRFVHVTTSAGIPIRFLLNHLRVPMVTEDKARAEQFQGYVLSVALTGPRDIGKRIEDIVQQRFAA